MTPHIPSVFQGKVLLVGAGPGAPDLLTFKAAQAIASATVILVDDLVNTAVLSHACPTARIVQVGKRGGCRSTPQAFIEKLMIMAAKEGQTVVRLKGGDPFIFGRGGEEVEALQAAGIEVQVINGITSGLAAATALRTPLTHRDHAHGVVFITGHAKPGSTGPDWQLLSRTAAQAKLSLVIYMGVSGVQHISSGLLTGLPAATPVAVVQHASLPQQRIHHTTLGALADDVAIHKLASPSVLLIGDVFAAQSALERETPIHALG
jgi:uroporphyrin-III C-methyltransferase